MYLLAIFMVVLFAIAGYSDASGYCVCNTALSDAVLQNNIDYACGAGADCGQISPNGPCFNPNTVKDHCNFAVNSYYQKKGQVTGSCVFSGTAIVSQTPPPGANSVCYSGNPSTSTPTPPGTGTGTPTPGTGTGTPGTGTGTGTPGTGTGTGTPGTGTGTGTPGTGTGTPGSGTGTGSPGTGTGTGSPGTGTGTGSPGTGTGTGSPGTGTGTGTGTPGSGTGTGTGTGVGTGSGTMPGINVNPPLGLAPDGTNGYDSSGSSVSYLHQIANFFSLLTLLVVGLLI